MRRQSLAVGLALALFFWIALPTFAAPSIEASPGWVTSVLDWSHGWVESLLIWIDQSTSAPDPDPDPDSEIGPGIEPGGTAAPDPKA
ncbi:MAG: hypothetical protein AAGN66_05760 [Acidobacteriota bacterium]